MNEERMLILKMVAEGTITAEEAESLLQTLEDIDESKRGVSEQSSPGNQQAGVVELLKAGAEVLRDQALSIKAEVLKSQHKFLRNQKRALRNSLREVQREKHRDRDHGESRRTRHEEPRIRHRIETGERVDLEIDHRHGDIEVASWAGNDLEIMYQKIVWAEDEETAKEIASAIEIQIDHDEASSNTGTRVSITTDYPEDRELWRDNRRRARVNYWLQVPQQTNLQIDNQHGNVSVRDLRGTTTVGNQHGDVSVHAIDGDLNLDTCHGNVEVDSIQGNVQFKGGHGNADFGKVGGSLEGDRAHGNLELHGIQGDLTLTHRHGHAEADAVHGVIRIDKHHGHIELKGVRDTFHINAHHANLHLNVTSPLSGDCLIKGHHAQVDLIAPANAFALIQASTHHGSISSEFEGDLIKKKHDQQFTATPNDSGANLEITDHHGRINLRRRGAVITADDQEIVEQEETGGESDE